MTIGGNFERFQYFKFERDFLENQNLVGKTGVPLFSWKQVRLKMHYFHTKLPYQKPMLGQIEWWAKNGPVTKNGVLPWKFCFSLRTSYQELIWCTNDPNAQIPIFIIAVSAGVLFDGAFSLWVYLRRKIFLT